MKKKVKLSLYSILLIGIVFACQKLENGIENSMLDLIEAWNWYYNNHSPEIYLKSEKNPQGAVIGVPNWDLAIINKHKDSKTVEVPLIVTNQFYFASEESFKDEFGNKSFTSSRTTMVVEIAENETIGFLMTLIPDKTYLGTNDSEVFSSTYKNWENRFSGVVLYHNLDGSLSNGWKLSRGYVIAPLNYVKELISMKSTACYYYFFVLQITDCSPYYNLTKGSNGCITYEEWYYMYDDCHGVPEGGGGGGGEYVAIPSLQGGTPHVDIIYNSSSTLNSSQKILLEAAILGFINEYSVTNTIWNKLVNHGVSLTFLMTQ